jgi:hypothetical protein
MAARYRAHTRTKTTKPFIALAADGRVFIVVDDE